MLIRVLLLIISSGVIISCNQKKEREVNPEVYVAKGDSIIARTFDTLRNTLVRAIGDQGFDGAVDFCNSRALSLTTLYAKNGISVKRTSDKLRNSANAPDSMERRILSQFLEQKTDKALKPVLEKDAKGNYHYFKPILIQSMCLNCHGNRVTQIQNATWKIIQEKYPGDAAFDYMEGDLRGLWHVTFATKLK